MTDPEEVQLTNLCRALNDQGVDYLVFGSYAGRLQGADLQTIDVDVVPERSQANLQRLCDALNALRPRWRVDDVPEGLRIDGGRLEPRHILGSSVALGLVTSAGLIDILLEPKGYERGYDELVLSAVTVEVGDGTSVRVGSLRDLIRTKQLLGREKDREHLPDLLARQRQMEIEKRKSHSPGDDRGPSLGL